MSTFDPQLEHGDIIPSACLVIVL